MIKKIFLASKSPRRLQILTEMGFEVELLDSDYEEDNTLDLPPKEIAALHAEGKAKAALKNIKEGLVLGGDTFVALMGKVIGKPKSREDAKKMLKEMSGRMHKVISGVCLIDAKTQKTLTRTYVTKVFFIDLTDEMIDKYLDVAKYMDKAGAYAIQEEASVFVDKTKGSYTNIMGLPKELVLEMIEEFYK